MVKKKKDPEYRIKVQNADGTYSSLDTLKGKGTITEHLSHYKGLVGKSDHQSLSLSKISNNLSSAIVKHHAAWLAKLIIPAGPLMNRTYAVDLNIKDVFLEFLSKLDTSELMQVNTEAATKAIHEYYGTYRNLWLTPITKQLDNEKGFTQKEVALICIYKGIIITRSNALQYTIQYGLTSTEKLYQEYTCFSSLQNRIGIDDTSARKNNNKIKLLEKVITLLSDDPTAQSKAENDISTLKSKIIQN